MNRFLYLATISAIGVVSCLSPGWATPMIVVGDIDLLPDMPGQTVDLLVIGGDPVEGMNFNIQVADGGPAAGGSVMGPSLIAEIEIGTIFEGNNTGAVNLEAPPLPQAEFWTIITESGTVSADGVVARLTFDTTGFDSGEFPLLLTSTLNGDTDFIDVIPEIQNGLIRVVPEPTGFLLAVLPLCWWLKKRRLRKSK